jgi:hypothetical protein
LEIYSNPKKFSENIAPFGRQRGRKKNVACSRTFWWHLRQGDPLISMHKKEPPSGHASLVKRKLENSIPRLHNRDFPEGHSNFYFSGAIGRK